MTKYQEPQAINNLVEFSQAFNFDCHEEHKWPDEHVANLRVNLIDEEFSELKLALADGDSVRVLDALGDIQYVLSGTVVAFGFTKHFAEAFAEIHRSNMSKACKTMDEAVATAKYHSEGGTECHIEQNGELFLVRRTSDNKLLKSINYSPADLSQFV